MLNRIKFKVFDVSYGDILRLFLLRNNNSSRFSDERLLPWAVTLAPVALKTRYAGTDMPGTLSMCFARRASLGNLGHREHHKGQEIGSHRNRWSPPAFLKFQTYCFFLAWRGFDWCGIFQNIKSEQSCQSILCPRLFSGGGAGSVGLPCGIAAGSERRASLTISVWTSSHSTSDTNADAIISVVKVGESTVLRDPKSSCISHFILVTAVMSSRLGGKFAANSVLVKI